MEAVIASSAEAVLESIGVDWHPKSSITTQAQKAGFRLMVLRSIINKPISDSALD